MILKSLLLFISLSSVITPLLSISDNTYESKGNGFHLIDKTYSVSDSFCFTSKISFVSGQAAGILLGSSEDEHYWLFNVDRNDNKTKLIYFSKSEGVINEIVYKEENFIGSSTITESELSIVKRGLSSNCDFYFKVVLTRSDEHAYADFYIDNIKRFGVDSKIDLNALNSYEGGQIGFNTFNSKINVSEIYNGKSDYAYYSELYRQQYHYSQFAHWNNDPNGLVYYKGYYHLYYQTNPFSKYWGDMYWGHARSTDLLHWEELPYALFPDDGSLGFGSSDGYAWSGSAFVYRKGMSSTIDSENWYPNGNGDGLFAIYTRDGSKQDQVIISSDDEGFSWTRRKLISQETVAPGNKVSCRDPKIFSLVTDSVGKTTRYGMCVSNMDENIVYFLTSLDLLSWSSAGSFKVYHPECVDVIKLAIDGEDKDVLTISGREYFVGNLSFDETKNKINFIDEKGKSLKDYDLAIGKNMDFGPDRYATQSFYINDETSIYDGKAVAMSWFSGVPNAAASVDSGMFANVRSSWNGGGQTIPVIYGLIKESGEYLLTETPIVKDNSNLNKDVLVNESDIATASIDLLSEVNSHTLEIDLSFANETEFELRVNLSEDEYTSIGYSKIDGYYVDRTHTSDAGLSFANYHVFYSTGKIDEEATSIYALVDNGSLEVYAGNFKYSFYVLTLASPTSVGASLIVDEGVTIKSLLVNKISSVWKNASTDESVIYLNEDDVTLDMQLSTSKKIIAYDSLNKELVWSFSFGDDVISLNQTNYGAILTSKKVGEAEINVANSTSSRTIHINVLGGNADSDLNFSSSSIISGQWFNTNDAIIGEQSSGDGYLLSSSNETDFSLTLNVSLNYGAAFGVVFRAKSDMSEYLIANYDNNSKITKLWSNKREIANVSVGDLDLENIVFSLSVNDNRVIVKINNTQYIDATLTNEEPREGYLGLNVCAANVSFNSIALIKSYYEYTTGKLVITQGLEQYISAIYNTTLKNTKICQDYYSVNGRNITIDEEYFKSLIDDTTYEFVVYGEKDNFSFKVKTNKIERDVIFTDLTSIEGDNINIFINHYSVESISINDVTLTLDQYSVKDGVLKLDGSLFKVGSNKVVINGTEEFNVEVSKRKSIEIKDEEKLSFNYLWILIPCLTIVLIGTILITFIIIKKRKAKARKDA